MDMLSLRHVLRSLTVCIGSVSIAPIITRTCAAQENGVPTGRFLLFSDAHYDPYYGTNLAYKHSHIDSPVSVPCRDSDAPKFSAYGCGSSKALITSAVASAAQILPNPDFILFTGDATRHGTFQVPNVSATVESAMALVPELIQNYFPNTSLISLPPLDIGNNDLEGDYTINITSTIPCTIFENGTEFPNATNPWLINMATKFKSLFVTEQEAAAFACGGYLVRHVTQDLSIIVLNTVVWSKYLKTDAMEEELESDDFDPFGQHAWLNATLAELQSLGKKAYVTGHIPPILQSYRSALAKSLMYEQHVRRYYESLANYQTTVIAGQFFGHVHSNELRHFPQNDKNHPPMVVVGSISPCYRSTPFFTIVDYDLTGGTYCPIDIATYNVDLASSTATLSDEDVTVVRFQPMFDSLVKYLGMDNLTNGEVARLASRLATEDSSTLWNKYWNRWLQGIQQEKCNASCRLEQACIIKCGTHTDFYQSCINNDPKCSLSAEAYARVYRQSRGTLQFILWIGIAVAVTVLGTMTYKGIQTCRRRRGGRVPLPDADVMADADQNPEEEIDNRRPIPSIT